MIRGNMSMQLDKSAIDKLLLLDDNGLWAVIKMIASQSGITLLQKAEPNEIAAIRNALGGASDSDIAAAAELLRKFKEQNGG